MNSDYFIQGSNVRVYKYLSDQPTTPYEIVCGTDVVIEFNQELIGATTPESGRFKEVRPRMRQASMTISGATTSTNDSNLSIFHFLSDDEFIASQDLEIVYTDNGGNERSIRGNWYIERLPITAPVGEASTYEINLKSSGDYVISELVDPVVDGGDHVTSDSYTVSGGKIQDSAWIGLTSANIVEVCREGSEQLSLGLPYSFNGTTGEITPDPGTVIDGQRMFVIWTY